MPPAENLSKPSVVRRIPTVKGQTSVWRDCCPCGREKMRGSAPAVAAQRPHTPLGPPPGPVRRPGRVHPEVLFERGGGVARRASDVLLVCGRAPGRALSYGRFGGACMGAAWVGPLHWTQWAGGHCRLIPRRRWTGPGGGRDLPDRAWTPVRGGRRAGPGPLPLRRRPSATGGGFAGGLREESGNEVGRKGTSDVPSWLSPGCNAPREWPNVVGRPRLDRPIRGHPADRSVFARHRSVAVRGVAGFRPVDLARTGKATGPPCKPVGA